MLTLTRCNQRLSLPLLFARAIRSSVVHQKEFSTRAESPKDKMSDLSDWSATTYLKFADDRTRAARDLLTQVPLSSPARVVDLGCGPGNSTELLTLRYPNSKVSGMDSSLNMLKKARDNLPNVTFELGDMSSYVAEESVDLFYSNAAFQWLPGTERIPAIQRLLQTQPSGGCFALQIPVVGVEPCHAAYLDVAADTRWGIDLTKNQPICDPPPTSQELYNAFAPVCSKVDIWYTYYEHHVANHEALVDWFSGSGMRPFLDALDESQQAEFVEMYRNIVKKAYPLLDDGTLLFKMPRLFMVLEKS